MVGPHHLDLHLSALRQRLSDQPVVRRDEPARLRVLGERQMQRIEWTEAETTEETCTLVDGRGDIDGSTCLLQPESGRQPPVFTRVPLVLELMSRGDDELNPPFSASSKIRATASASRRILSLLASSKGRLRAQMSR